VLPVSSESVEEGDALRAKFDAYRQSGDRTLRNQLIEAHRWLAVSCARRFDRRGEPLDDLVQVAMLGVLKAVERFDPAFGVAFKTFAAPTIMGELRRHFRDTTWRIKVPRRVQELHLALQPANERLTHQLGRSPTPAELATVLSATVEDVVDALAAGANYRPLPLLHRGGEDDDDLSADAPALCSWEPGYDDVADRERIGLLLSRLPERERRIVYLRYFRYRTQSQIAEEVGLSQVHVSRLLRVAVERLRVLATAEQARERARDRRRQEPGDEG
jgi:RNA polymerase sigma-B factor